MKRFFFTLSFFFLAISLHPVYAQNATTPTTEDVPNAGKIAATVNGIPIMAAAIDAQLVSPEARQRILNALITRELIIQDFKKTGGQIPASDIDNRIKEIIKNEYGNDSVAFTATLKERGITLEKYRNEIEDNAIVGHERLIHFNKKLPSDRKAAEAKLEDELHQWEATLRKEATIQIFSN